MVVIEKKKTLIFTPPKCGSTMFHQVMMPQGYRLDGPQFGNDIGKHTTYVPYGMLKYRKLCLVRDPEDRFRSLYNHYCRVVADVSQEWYLERWESFFKFFSQTLGEMLPPIDGIIRLEHLQRDVEKQLGFTINVVSLNVAPKIKDIQTPISFIEGDLCGYSRFLATTYVYS